MCRLVEEKNSSPEIDKWDIVKMEKSRPTVPTCWQLAL
jgi:hypothetical protein